MYENIYQAQWKQVNIEHCGGEGGGGGLMVDMRSCSPLKIFKTKFPFVIIVTWIFHDVYLKMFLIPPCLYIC